jgi:hypothetical protein
MPVRRVARVLLITVLIVLVLVRYAVKQYFRKEMRLRRALPY